MPNFQDVSSLGKIVSYKDKKEGEILISYGTYMGQTSNQYGALYNFEEVESGEKKALAKCGKLAWLVTSEVLKPGFRYQVKFKGRGVIDKGSWKGKEFVDVEVLQDRDYVPGQGSSNNAPAFDNASEDDMNPDDLLG